MLEDYRCTMGVTLAGAGGGAATDAAAAAAEGGRDGDVVVYMRGEVGRCRVTVSKPVLKAPVVSALETTM